MLTQKCIKFTKRAGRVYPSIYYKAKDRQLAAETAQEVADLFCQNIGSNFETIQTQCKDLSSSRSELVAACFEICEGLAKWQGAPDELNIERRDVLIAAEELRCGDEFSGRSAFVASLAERLCCTELQLEAIYRDLPQFKVMSEFDVIDPDLIVDLYNRYQVQGLLLHSTSILLKLKSPSTATLRSLTRMIKFFGLVADINLENDLCQVTVSGPAAVVGQAQIYGRKMANFFATFLALKGWEIEADLVLKKQDFKLKLSDAKCGVKHSKPWRESYIPDEIETFLTTFSTQLPGWEIDWRPEFVPLVGRSYCFPDFVLKSKEGESIYIELFHRWHQAQYEQRRQALELSGRKDVFLGIEGSIAAKLQKKGIIKKKVKIDGNSFIFKDLPSVGILTKIIDIHLN
jgi:predicted nuclease of restriction endonuclease-like RecB superfamily